jgi:pyruvate formate lyase activating enzyme
MGDIKHMEGINMEERTVKGTVFDIRRFSTHDGGGIRTTVFLKGCPLSCVWCHNPEGISTRVRPLYFPNKCIGCQICCRLSENGGIFMTEKGIRIDITKTEDWDRIIEECPSGAILWDSIRMTVEDVVKEVLKDAPFYKYGGGVTLSGGEPLLQPEFVISFLKEMKKRNIHTAIETALYVPTETLEAVLPWLDLIYADFKIIEPEVHKKYIGVTNERIKKHIRLLLEAENRDHVTIRTPMIPGLTTEEDNIAGISRFISEVYKEVSYEILNYNPLGEAKYHLVDKTYCFNDNPKPYSRQDMELFAKIARSNGVDHIILES